MKTVGLLTTLGSSILAPVVEALNQQGVALGAVIIDGKLKDKDMEIESQRLDPSFKRKDVSEIDFGMTPCFFVNHNSEQCVELIQKLQLQYLLNAGTPRILKNQILTITGGVINSHPGILPQYRGCTAVEWSIFNGDPVGATAHFMTETIDEGPILLTETMPTKTGETYESIRTRMIEHQSQLLAKAAKLALVQNLSVKNMKPQDPKAGTYHKPIPPESLIALKEKLAAGGYKSG